MYLKWARYQKDAHTLTFIMKKGLCGPLMGRPRTVAACGEKRAEQIEFIQQPRQHYCTGTKLNLVFFIYLAYFNGLI